MKKQVRAVYSGRVQGVGFRFTAQSIAGALKITGWVKNLSDGTVEILAQGEEEALKDYLGRIQNYFHNYIQDINTSWQEANNNFKDFGVKF